jgi:hypothetical protein
MMDNELPKLSEFLKQEGIEVRCLQQHCFFFLFAQLQAYPTSNLFQRFQVSLAPFATKWLMTIFCNVLPLETTLRFAAALQHAPFNTIVATIAPIMFHLVKLISV